MRGTRGVLLALVLGLGALSLLGGSERAAAGPPPLPLILDPVGAFSYPVFVTSPPGDQGRLFVVQHGGVVKLVLDGVVQAAPFLDASSWVDFGGDQGLLSVAFAPDYATSGRFYIAYTPADENALAVDEVHRDASDPNVADPGTRRLVISMPHPSISTHYGGQLQFGPDGMLYISTGDGGCCGDPFRSAQNLHDYRGKVLRIDPRQDGASPYRVPPNNPFVGRANAYPEIWSYGLRNPWRFSFDRSKGAFTLGDVGQDAWEEIDYRSVPLGWGRGANFGWSCYEARHPYNTCSPMPTGTVFPVFAYGHSGRCSITGGYVVRDRELPLLLGQYVYGDFCDGEIRSQFLPSATTAGEADTGLHVNSLASFGEDACGHVYAIGVTGPGAENVFRIRQTDPPPPDCTSAFLLPVLTASVDDNFEIHLRRNGNELDGGTLPQGSYRLELDDNSTFHNFHLLGSVSCVPVSSCASTVAETGHQTWTVNFSAGKAEYQCDPHAGAMHGAFRVLAGQPGG
jgi:hypothetical protein